MTPEQQAAGAPVSISKNPGQITLPVSDTLWQELVDEARRTGFSVEQLVRARVHQTWYGAVVAAANNPSVN